ncbi:MAG: phosphoribosylformylglycinamidine cyclo-ligase [Chloroflexi bacterium]|nr:phosphoribosylformylglycinamidine cyclo-ligase [Chloroflexota bacterium]
MTEVRDAYAEAGVDVAAGERAVELLRVRLGGTSGENVISGIGGFASAVAMPTGYREPVLVSATDGVGTKTAIAAALHRFDTIGQDLVAMCVDDVVCLGANPLFFLDYIALGRLEPADVAELVAGVAAGCELARCALVGGETAEHPGLMEPDQFDLAGFCVGVAEREDLLDIKRVRAGHVLLGMASSGLHANGYSLIRALVSRNELELTAPYLEVLGSVLGQSAADTASGEEPASALATLGEVLLTPTRIYAQDVLTLRTHLAQLGMPLVGLAHVTGGGLPGNVPRALPIGLGASIEVGAWPGPSIFGLLQALGGLDGAELRATFNAGIGMVAVLPADALHEAVTFLSARGLSSWQIGEVFETAPDGLRYTEVDARGTIARS